MNYVVKDVDSNRQQLILSKICMWYDFSDRYDFANFPLHAHIFCIFIRGNFIPKTICITVYFQNIYLFIVAIKFLFNATIFSNSIDKRIIFPKTVWNFIKCF